LAQLGKITRYALLPEILPRISRFFQSGFSSLALFTAYVFYAARLLPRDHAYLMPQNFGRFGLRHVIFEAKRALVYDRAHIDQVLIFYTILAGLVILFIQFAFLILAALMPMAQASGFGAYLATFFVTPDPTYDLAFRMLDFTFGLNGGGIVPFNSCVAQGTQCQLIFTPGGGGAYTLSGPTYSVPTPLHNGLHMLFQFYNIAIFGIAMAIVLYFFAAMVAETAKSGTPFGQRFNGAWAPIRLFVALGLLVPLSYGMNGAQLMTFGVAKWGSSFATNGWNGFVDDLSGTTLLGERDRLVATPNRPEIVDTIQFTFVALTCRVTELLMNERWIRPYVINADGSDSRPIDISSPGAPAPFDPMAPVVPQIGSLNDALTFTENQDVVIRFGVRDEDDYQDERGFVRPICGEITLRVQDIAQPGALIMQEYYYEIIIQLFRDDAQRQFAIDVMRRTTPTDHRQPNVPMPDNAYIADTISFYQDDMLGDGIAAAVAAQVASDEWLDQFRPLGWMGAAIWYNKIAELNGGMIAAVFATPTPSLYPEVMEEVLEQRRVHNASVAGNDRFSPQLRNGQMIEFGDPRKLAQAPIYYQAYNLWADRYEVDATGNSFTDTIIMLFGLNGLMSMTENADIHPLAQLVAVGRSLMESAIIKLGLAAIGGGVTMFTGTGGIIGNAASFAGQVGTVTLSIGFILYYIIPFLPFIYFFFAAGGWLKSIFEAMVGLPLWAMAHIRIDGEGLPGPVAMNGYYLLLDIFMRPILIVVGLIAGITIFAAQVQVLNEIWPLVTSNLAGFEENTTGAPAGTLGAYPGPIAGTIEYFRSATDQLFFTVIYTIIVYMMGNASFKLIDLIPNNILRWIGSSVATFSEQAGDPAGKLVAYAFTGSQFAVGSMNSATRGLAARSMLG
jgi:hypothetical protein